MSSSKVARIKVFVTAKGAKIPAYWIVDHPADFPVVVFPDGRIEYANFDDMSVVDPLFNAIGS